MIRVVQLLPELNEGGVERGVVEINREFVGLDVESHVVSRGGKLVPVIESDGGVHHSFDICSKNILTAPGRSWGLRRILSSIDPSVIHARSRVPAWLVWFANKKLKLPLVTTVHGLNSVNPYSKIMTCGQRVICVSEVIRDYVVKHYQTNPEKIRVIQRGVDMDYFDPRNANQEIVQKLCNSLGLEGKTVIASIGRITRLKDYETFIKAMARITRAHPETVGLIVGGYREDKAQYFHSLKKLAVDERVSNNIVFAGSQSDMRSIYSLSDVIVNASLKMGNMGRTVVEALAMGKPVVATTFQGLRNLVEDGVNGHVIENRDIDGLVSAIGHILNADYNLDDIRRTVPFEYTLECMVSQILDVYREVIAM